MRRAGRYAPTMADTPKPPADIQLQIQIDDEVANGQYVNMALVNQTETEFTLDFIYIPPQQPREQQRGKVRSRIITSPKHLKRLLAVLQEGITKYESRYGVIPVDDRPVH
jgi:hypothetical protein